MKKYVLLLSILCSIAVWSGTGFCQTPTPGCPANNLGIQKPSLIINNIKNSPVIENGTYFYVNLLTFGNPTVLMNRLERISAQNYTNPETDDYVYEFDLTPILRNMVSQFLGGNKFKGQYGMYELKIERSTDLPPGVTYLPNPFLCYSDPIDANLNPLPVPENLKVSFKSDATTPTLSFDPVSGFPSGTNEWYEIRIYDKDYTRRIYRVTIGMETCGSYGGCSKPDTNPSVTYPDYRSLGSQTYEDLIPGQEYIFRADLMKELPGGPPERNLIQSINFKSFTVPKMNK